MVIFRTTVELVTVKAGLLTHLKQLNKNPFKKDPLNKI